MHKHYNFNNAENSLTGLLIIEVVALLFIICLIAYLLNILKKQKPNYGIQ